MDPRKVWNLAAEAIRVGLKGLAKTIVGADASAEMRRLDKLIADAKREGRQ